MKLRDIILSGIWLIAIIGIVFLYQFPESHDTIFKIIVWVEIIFFICMILPILKGKNKGE